MRNKEPFPYKYGKYSMALLPKFFIDDQQFHLISIAYTEEADRFKWALSLLFID